MPRLLVLVAALALARAAGADDHRYIEAGSAHELSVLRGPVPAELFGRRSVEALAAARALIAGESPVAPAPAPFAIAASAPPAVAWQPAASAPFAVDRALGEPATLLGDVGRERVAAVYLRRSFQVGEEAARLRVLRLRALYQDGLVAWINDREVARRNLDPGLAPGGFAARAHGPEWETFYLAVEPGLLHPGENTLTLEVRPSVQRLGPWIDVELTGGEQARIVRGPILLGVGPARATLTFETDLPSRGEVRWGTAASSYPNRAASPAPATRHVIALDKLPRGEIHYQIAADEERSGDHVFHTAPEPGEVVRFVVYGDVRSGHEQHTELVRVIEDEAPDFVLATGDMVLRGTDEGDWQRFFSVAGGLLATVPFYPVVGNHDLGADRDGPRRFEDVFGLPGGWWSFDAGDVHVAVLDSNRWSDPRQMAWLDEDLSRARAAGARVLFAAAHHGLWSRGPHGGHPAGLPYAPLLEKHGVAVLFSGHDHFYERGKVGQVRYVVSGGGGAALYQPRCGARGQKRCPPDGAEIVASAYHYVVVEVYRDYVKMCPRRPEGTPLEECTIFAPPAEITLAR